MATETYYSLMIRRLHFHLQEIVTDQTETDFVRFVTIHALHNVRVFEKAAKKANPPITSFFTYIHVYDQTWMYVMYGMT